MSTEKESHIQNSDLGDQDDVSRLLETEDQQNTTDRPQVSWIRGICNNVVAFFLRWYTVPEITELRAEIVRLNTQLASSNESCSNAEEKAMKYKKEKEKALIRLSEMASTKLTFNNPGIADLSDKNRPNKLAEMFSELYDNEWTESYDVISGKFGDDEKQIVTQLLSLVKEVYNFCHHVAWQQRSSLEESLFSPIQKSDTENQTVPVPAGGAIDIHVRKKLSDVHKELAIYILPRVKQDFERQVTNEDIRYILENCKLYYEKCFEICWLMCVIDPPVALDFGDGDFNKDHFKEYTKAGEKIDFIAWPAMLLHKDGPLLHKGVWQPI